MKKLLILAFFVLNLAGCAALTTPTAPPPSVVVQYQTQLVTIPDEVLTVPAPIDPIDFSTKPSQKDVASWLVKKEERTRILENNLNEVKKIQADQQAKAQATVPATIPQPAAQGK